MNRTTEKELIYKKHLSSIDRTVCHFCNLPAEEIKSDYKSFLVVINPYGYQFWDGCSVVDHLMVVPKRHINHRGEFTKEEKAEFMDIVSAFEGDGYDVYSRGDKSIGRTVLHQHTHLIKTDNRKIQSMIFNREPYKTTVDF